MQTAEKLSITLPAEMAGMIRAKVRSGAYGSNSEVIREALRDWSERERRLSSLDDALAHGLSDAKTGRVKPAEKVFGRLEKKYKGMMKKRSRS